MMRKVFLLFGVILNVSQAIAQSSQLPSVIPPSPETSALFGFLDYPVNLSTGQVKISIPVYEMDCGSLKVPISLSYNAGGRKVFDETGPVGLGWSLMAGGEIARTIYGKPDDQYPFVPTVKSASDLSNQSDYDYLASIYYDDRSFQGGDYDTQYDIFSYYFGSYSGRFVVDRSPAEPMVYTIPSAPVKIQPSTFPSYIIDDNGNTYNFTQDERYDEMLNAQPVTGKLLTSIISADKKDTISFTYEAFNKISRKRTQDVVVLDDVNSYDGNMEGSCSSVTNSTMQTQNNDNFYNYYVQRLVEIKCRNQKVEFQLDGTSDRVKSIEVYDASGKLIKKIELQMSIIDTPINGSTESVYTLDKLIFEDPNGNAGYNYSFDYNPSVNFSTTNRDFFGFLNGTSQTNLVPTYDNVMVISGDGGGRYGSYVSVGAGANRNSNDNMKKSALSKITYPTGGSTSFTYEVNEYERGGSGGVYAGGGLRISQVETDDGNGHIRYRTFKYGDNEDGRGTLPVDDILMQYMSSESRYFTDLYPDAPSLSSTAGYRKRDYSSEFLSGIGAWANEPVYYDKVTEYEGTLTDNIGKKVYEYEWAPGNTAYKRTLAHFPLPVFPNIVEGVQFSNVAVDANLQRPYISKYDLYDDNDLMGLTTYKNNGDNTYSPVKSVSYNYETKITKVLEGLKVYKYLNISNCSGSYNQYDLERGAATFYELPMFLFANYDFDIGQKQLMSVSETDYLNGSAISKSTDYTYNSNLLKETAKQTLSNGEQLTTHYKYPLDYTVDGSATDPVAQGILNLQDQHNISQVIEQYTQMADGDGSNLRTVSASLTTFKPSISLPDRVYELENSSPLTDFIPTSITNTAVSKNAHYIQRLDFDNYNPYGKILEQHKVGDEEYCYLWDYNSSYPIAEVKNAGQSDIAYTSFEADGNGNWNIPTGGASTAYAITGSSCYNLGSAGGTGITKSGLNSSETYVVSYWTRNGSSYSISGTQGSVIKGKTINGWTYYEHHVTGVSSVAITGSGYIDELRLYPTDALMSTYTYKPLIGMTSTCGPDNTIQYDEYDGFGRLIRVKNEDGMILKQYDYKYQVSANQ